MKTTIHGLKWLIVGVAAVFAFAGEAGEFVLKSTLTAGFDWSLDSSYEGGSAPGTGDTIVVPSGMTATLSSSSASFGFVSARARVTPLGTFVIDVSDGTAAFNAAISLRGKANADIGAGTIQKTGAGTLQLTKRGLTETSFGMTTDYSFDVNFLVSNGRVELPQDLPNNATFYNFRHINLEANGVLKCPWSGVERKSISFRITGGLSGAGTLEAATETDAAETLVYYNSPGVPRQVFSGKLSGGMSFQIQDGSIDFTGTESSIAGTTYANGNISVNSTTDHTNVVGVASFNNPGSFGGVLYAGLGTDAYSHIRYLGEGETTSSGLGVRPTVNGWNILDGGPNGGLVINGSMTISSGDTTGRQTRFIFAGDNANRCEFNGVLQNRSLGADNSTYYVEKRGTGTWKLGGGWVPGAGGTRNNRGLYAICDGTLQYETIDEKGENCSLGRATETYEYKDGTLDPSYETTYAIRLGSTNAADVACDPKFQYVGESAATVTTRPIGIANKGTLLSGTAPIDWTGIAPVGKDNATLVLDGTDTSGANSVRGLTDNAAGGKLGIAKRGTGTWTLDGEASLSGRVSVEQGKLAFNADTSMSYGYYRLTIRETAKNATRFNGVEEKGDSNSKMFFLQRIGLFDSDGNWLCGDFTYKPDWTDLQPGEVSIQNPEVLYYYRPTPESSTIGPHVAELVTNLFWSADLYNSVNFMMADPIAYANTNAHLQIVMRLRDADVGKAVRFNMLYTAMTTSGYPWKTCPTAYTLEGSGSGKSWTLIDDRQLTTSEVSSSGNYWWVQDHKSYGVAKGGNSFVPSERKGKGWEIATARAAAVPHVAMLENAEVAVSSGASLQAIGGETAISRLVVDCMGGAGSFSGMTLASSGTLVLENAVDGNVIQVPISSANGLDVSPLSGWNVQVGDRVRSSRSVNVRNGVVYVVKSGAIFIVR